MKRAPVVKAEGQHRIGAVSRLTGVSEHSLRAWERRYGILQPRRTPGGDRVYTDADIRRLRLLKRLTDYGHGIGDVARLDERALEDLLAEHRVEPVDDVTGAETVERILSSVETFDVVQTEYLLGRAILVHRPADFVMHVAQPLLEEIGKRWRRGALTPAHEHAVSAILRTSLGALLARMPTRPNAPVVIVGTMAGERHEFGALFTGIIAALASMRVIYLGPDLPSEDIATAARATSAVAVALSIPSPAPRGARAELAALRSALPARTRLFVGGGAAEDVSKHVAKVTFIRDLATFASALTVDTSAHGK